MKQPTRRQALQAAALLGLSQKGGRRIDGRFVDSSHAIGHTLRDRVEPPAPKRTERVPVVIVGGGVAGLSAAWRLDKRGFRDFVVLEMESEAGGNSRGGANEVSRYPWAAHYVPVPGAKASLVRELFEELGVWRDGEWEERFLCHSPQERLYLHGRWQEGLIPEVAAGRSDHDQYRRFEEAMAEFRASGEFAIPTESGRLRRMDLDRISMADWMRGQGFDSEYLNWHVDYSCRDDYGASAAQASAWAGIHYFASREADEKGPLTWPEGNGWIVARLLEKLGGKVRTGAFVHAIRRAGARYRVRTTEVDYDAGFVIFAAPTFLASFLVEDFPAMAGWIYSPWLTANLTLDQWPREKGLPPAWDNVIYGSPSLGYVVATHQSLRTRIEKTVWTYYWALTDRDPSQARQALLDRDWGYWKDAILSDLRRAHPDIEECVTRVDIMRLGHAMIRPTPGFHESESRRRMAMPRGRLVLANSDLSGLSLFEEAQYRGVRAAEHVLRQLGGR
jgi:phytoene dehydrogenase-like protein